MTLFQQMNQQNQNSQMNPYIKQIIDLIKMSGKSPKDLFFDECQKRNVDPNTILNQLR